MRKLVIKVDGRDEPLEVSILEDRGDTALVRVDGVDVELSTRDLKGERTLVLEQSESYVVDSRGSGGVYELIDHEGSVSMKVMDERDTWLGVGAGADDSGSVTVAMPGRVVSVLVEVGQEVVRGDRLVVIEAMKMENDVKAPRDGTVSSIHAREGQSVEAGEALVDLE